MLERMEDGAGTVAAEKKKEFNWKKLVLLVLLGSL